MRFVYLVLYVVLYFMGLKTKVGSDALYIGSIIWLAALYIRDTKEEP